jgi:hypothetical protein
MRRHPAIRSIVLGAFCCAALLLASCASTTGTTLSTVTATEKATQAPRTSSTRTVPPPSSGSETKKGLEVVTDPDYAEVWIDGSFKGLTPYTFEDISPGRHQVLLRKDGYYETAAWIEFSGDYVLYQASLQQIIGFLKVSVSPAESLVTVGGDRVAPGMIQLPIGAYTVTVRAFGYTDVHVNAVVSENAVTEVTAVLTEAPFAVTAWSVPKTSVNPGNPGLLGTLEASFSVTGPGTGVMRVLDATGSEVYSRSLPDFKTWDQSISWNASDARGQALPDGAYTLEIDVHAHGSDETTVRRTEIRVDRTLKIAARSVWSGSSGLLYAPVTEVLPPGDFQVQVLGAGIYDPATESLRAPVILSGRVGLPGKIEADASAGIVATSGDTHVLLNAAARWNWLSPKGSSGTGGAVQVKLSGQFTPQVDGVTPLMTDTFANFTGVSVEAPFQIVFGPVSALLCAGVTGSWWYPYGLNTDGSPEAGAVAWMYARAGLMLDLGSVTAGLSISTRTERLPGGAALLASPVPFQAGAEVHWLIPGTRLLLSGIAAGEYRNADNAYLMAGGGLGFLY